MKVADVNVTNVRIHHDSVVIELAESTDTVLIEKEELQKMLHQVIDLEYQRERNLALLDIF